MLEKLAPYLMHGFKRRGQSEKLIAPLRSSLCTEETLMSPVFQRWAECLKERPGHRHRKVWEWCFICQALFENDRLKTGKKGLGFAVGTEPLSALFSTYGAKITATDLFTDEAQAIGWVATGQHAAGYAGINARGITDEALLRRMVDFRFADMNHINAALHGQYDFTWSACAFEHLGSLEHGMQFVMNSMQCLKPGGIAVHTTEFNVSSNEETVETGDTVIYRRRDIETLAQRLRDAGHHIDIDYQMGESAVDEYVDVQPYKHDPHLKLQLGRYTTTSIGLIIRKGRRS